MAPQSAKKTLRARIREQLQQLDAADLAARSHAAAHRLFETEAFGKARALMLFLPLKHEIDARPIALRAWQQAKTVTVPLVSFEQKRMMPVEIRSLDEPMTEDRYGLKTPANGQPIPVSMVDLVIVPGLGFDHHGHRVGRGGGFYDRFLAQPEFQGVACGLALDEQLVERVPTADHDLPLDMLVTDRRTLSFDHRSRRPGGRA